MVVMLEIRGPATALLDAPPVLTVRGAGPGTQLRWRARLRDDDGHVWRAEAGRAEDLDGAWSAASGAAGPVAALTSLRPVAVDVRAEAPDGRAANRVLQRRLLGDGVRRRRWREAGGMRAALHLPAGDASCPAVVVPGTHVLAAALLASRGVMALALQAGDPDAAAQRLGAVPRAGSVTRLDDVPLPPGVPATGTDPVARAADWAALLDRLGASAPER
jgi:hypothetical protein